jgi:uroporphyrinogen III methyltransferase/synthase
LARAQVLIYDYLASPSLLALATNDCEKIYVGKIGSDHTFRQEEINALLVAKAKEGHLVVRLKGGDPYIFGRGGEEAQVLFASGVDFEVIPGVSSAIAAPAAAGIPLTHRELSSQVVILTGHEKPGKETSAHDWSALARIGTLSVVMGVENLPYLCGRLIEAGKDPATPAAMIQWGYTPRQKSVTATLSTLPAKAKSAGLGAPSVVVIGPVVELSSSLGWFERRPLWGRRILVTRTRAQAGRLSASLREMGAEVLEKPVIKIEPVAPNPALKDAFNRLDQYDWLILTSPNGASIFMKSLWDAGLDSRALGKVKIAVIGPGTAEALVPYGLKPDLVPSQYIAEGLVEAFSHLSAETGPPSGQRRCLLARSEIARAIVPVELKAMGYLVDEIPLYRTVSADGDTGPDSWSDLIANPPDLTTLTSASTAEGLASVIDCTKRHLFPTVSIGPITTQAAAELGFTVKTQALKATIGDLISACVALSGKKP